MTKIASPKRKGPPNRMNDLSYREWMRFQKSFFYFTDFSALAQETIQFFTKNQWPNGSISRSLIIGKDAQRLSESKLGFRFIERITAPPSIPHLINILSTKVSSNTRFDYVLIDLRDYFEDEKEIAIFLRGHALNLAQSIRELTEENKYCGLLVAFSHSKEFMFPFPWAVALACRNHLRLRDEKIGLIEEPGDENSIVYFLILQATADERPPTLLSPAGFNYASETFKIPLWLIVRSPPRSKDEKFHPAKFPEPLVEKFIQLFTNEGDRVFDPMAGTGSALLAAAKLNRAAFGLELIPTFVNITKKRVAAFYPKSLDQWLDDFETHKTSKPKIQILEGDARHISNNIPLQEQQFHYCITSPPYWSMLTSKGSEYQRQRRKDKILQTYSDDPRDLGNITDYDEFLNVLVDIYNQVALKLKDGGYLTIIVKNIKQKQVIYPLAWDLFRYLCRNDEKGKYDYVGTTLWCQNDTKIRPFALGIHWTSNTLHTFCIHFKKRSSGNSN
ncbi:MAG: DNA methyltransferase [Promethearchaeota archaeon]